MPQNYDSIWQACVSRLPTWLREGDRMIRPWSILVVDHSEHKILGQEVVTREPDAEMLFDCLAKAMRKPQFGKSYRPSEIQVRDEPVWNAVQTHLQEIGVDCIYHAELDEADYILGEMQKVMHSDRQPPALVEIENFHSSQGASFYQSAADFFRRGPWQRVPSDAAVQIDCPQLAEFGSSRWYAIVLGQEGQTYGLALYSQMCDIQAITGGCCSAEDGELGGTVMSMLFGEAFEAPIDDMLAAEKHHWPLAGPEAYPIILCTEGAMETRHAQPWELQLLEGCVRAIPDFLEQHPYFDASAATGARPHVGRETQIQVVVGRTRNRRLRLGLRRVRRGVGCSEIKPRCSSAGSPNWPSLNCCAQCRGGHRFEVSPARLKEKSFTRSRKGRSVHGPFFCAWRLHVSPISVLRIQQHETECRIHRTAEFAEEKGDEGSSCDVC